MGNHGAILLTGITGSVGAWLAGEALRHGRRVIALMRGSDPAEARWRLDTVLTTVGLSELSDRVSIVLGDIEQEGLGVNGSGAVLRAANLVIHCAGCTELQAEPARLHRINVEGTRRVLQLAEELGSDVVHVSTAYVAGRCIGTAREGELNPRREFNNPYERSKAQGEALVESWRRRTGRRVTILRPSVVLGDSCNGRKIGFNTIYPIMRAFDLVAVHARGHPLRVLADPGATKNFIPVDYFAQTAWRLVESCTGGTYHVTHPEPMTFARLKDIFTELFGICGLSIVDEMDFKQHPPTDAERLLLAANVAYLPYVMGEPRFDRTHTEVALGSRAPRVPALDLPFFDRLLQFARSRHWREPRQARLVVGRQCAG